MNWEAVKPLAAWAFRIVLNLAGTALMTHGIIDKGAGLETFLGLATSSGATFWSWWVTSGHLKAAEFLKNITQTATAAAAVEVAKRMQYTPAVATAATDAKVSVTASQPALMAKDAAKAAAVLLAVLILGALAFPESAFAQTPHKLNLPIDPLNLNGTPVTGNVKTDIQALWQKIVASSLTDLNYAAAMAQSANTTTATVRLQCLKAIITLNEQASGANLKNPDGTPMAKPDPHMFTDVESLAEIVDNLSPQGPLFVNCAGAAQLAKTNVLSFVNAVVTGAAGFAAMPIIPGL